MLLNLTSRRQVGPMMDGFFDRWPSPSDLVAADPEEVRDYIHRLGLSERRSSLLRSMSLAWMAKWGDGGTPGTREDVTSLPGCGEYAADAVEIFCKGNLSVQPSDRVLAEYVETRRRRDDQEGKDAAPS